MAHASTTAYGPHVQQPCRTVMAASAHIRASSDDSDVVLVPPPLNPSGPASFAVRLQAGTTPGLSIPHQDSFFGFNMELSVATQVLGLNSSLLPVPFINSLANIRERGGSVHVRVGGNTQDYAALTDSTHDDFAPEECHDISSNPTNTPLLIFTPEIIERMAKISSLTDVRLHMSIPFDDTQSWRLQAKAGESILGDYLAGLQPGNEPDHDTRRKQQSSDYRHKDYRNEFRRLIQATETDPDIPDEILIGPLGYFGSGPYAQTNGPSCLVLETNTALCGGFPGFGAALWAIDYGLQMAHANFTRTMFHVGGPDNYCNPFMPTKHCEACSHQWTIGPVYYSFLFVAETLGSSNRSQVLDLQMNKDNKSTPGYAIYENGRPTRVALVNLVDDNSGASDYTASISVEGTVPSRVGVKYLLAPSVTHGHDITWAGQTFGSDGRPIGVVDVQNVDCDQTNNVCHVKVPAPGAALVFLSDETLAESDQISTMTPPTGVSRLSVLVAVCAFVGLESLLSYAIGGKTMFSSIPGANKNAH